MKVILRRKIETNDLEFYKTDEVSAISFRPYLVFATFNGDGFSNMLWRMSLM
jgi:hypothetical protein